MSVGELSSYIFTGKYANHRAADGRRETREEAGQRMFDMHRAYYLGRGPLALEHTTNIVSTEDFSRLSALIDEAQAAYDQGLALGSQRVLQYGGVGVLRKHARAYNCCFSFADRPRFFQEAFWLLLCGSGTGFSVQRHHVARLPDVSAPEAGDKIVFQIPDTIEGWADALGALMSSYFVGVDDRYCGRVVEFDYSQIRPEGSPLSTGAGRAPGPEPLRRSLEKIRGLMSHCTADGGRQRMSTVDVYDVVMHASDAVLSGGVRRSASICLFSPDDMAMAQAKTGNWFAENPQRGRSNNSALLLRDETSAEQFRALVNMAREWGEPGFVWSDSTEMGVNPCVEASFWPVDVETGESGWQFCNLSLGNMGAVRNMDQARTAIRAAAVMGTLQAGYTSFPYLGEVSERITRREALLGVSMTGMAECPDIAFNPEALRELAKLVLDTNAEVSKILGIRAAARATCIKPEGTSSCMLGTSSGIHDHHAPRTIRHVQANHNEPQARWFSRHNAHAVERSVWSANDRDLVLAFAITAPDGSTFSADTGALDMLRRVKTVKESWVDAGRRPEACTQPWISHNVSNTVSVNDDEWALAADFIYDNRQAFAGVSLLSRSGDLDYPQAPFVEVLSDSEIVEIYGRFDERDYEIIDEACGAYRDLWDACDPVTSADDEVKRSLRSDWRWKFDGLANNAFAGDRRRTSHYLKAMYYWRRWQELTAKTTVVDYTQMREVESSVDFGQIVACAGNACQIL